MRRIDRILATVGVLAVVPAAAMARTTSVVPANPATRDAVQVPLSFVAYEQRTGLSVFSAGLGTNVNSWLIGTALRYQATDEWDNQLSRARGPAGALELELTMGNAGSVMSTLNLRHLCLRRGLKPDDCVLSNLEAADQAEYRRRGPTWDAPVMILLTVGGSLQQLVMRAPSDRSAEQGQTMFGARARLALAGYLGRALLGASVGAASVGAPPAQAAYCTPLGAGRPGSELGCTPVYLDSYNRTSILDARLEWRDAIGWMAFNPALQVIFQRSERDDSATPNDDSLFGLRYVDLDVPVYFYIHEENGPGFYAGLRGMLRWWKVDRARDLEAMGGFFVGFAYGGAQQRPRWGRVRSEASE